MSKRHTITVEDLTAYLEKDGWHMAASSSSATSRKRLEVSTKGELRVTDHDDVTYLGKDIRLAVAAYNSAL